VSRYNCGNKVTAEMGVRAESRLIPAENVYITELRPWIAEAPKRGKGSRNNAEVSEAACCGALSRRTYGRTGSWAASQHTLQRFVGALVRRGRSRAEKLSFGGFVILLQRFATPRGSIGARVHAIGALDTKELIYGHPEVD
jgi:hypothetical protein